MARSGVRKLRAEDIQGRKYLKVFNEMLGKLRLHADQDGAAAKNRKLHFDHYVGLLLLYYYTPVLTSLRSIQRASELKNVQRMLGCSRAALGSLSEASSVFDPAVLREVIRNLASEVEVQGDVSNKALEGLTAVDGTLLKAIPKMTWALWRRDEKNRAAKVHLVFDILRQAPADATLTDANASEKQQLRGMLEKGRFYVLDAGYAQYKLFADIIDVGSSFVCRIRDDAAWKLIETREISSEAEAAGVELDVVVRIGCPNTRARIKRPVRVIKVQPPSIDGVQRDPMFLATDRLDLDAELVALAYRHRWSVELFFKWFKCILGCRQLLSHSERGLTIQVYMGIIASLLISVWIRRKPTKATLEMLWFYMSGMADDEELIAHVERLQKHAKS